MIDNTIDFYVEAQGAANTFDAFISQYSLVNEVVADHICYKCSSPRVFETMRSLLEKEGWMYQAMIAKRRIATIKIQDHIETLAGKINLLELSDQKPDRSQTDGFDHIEIYPTRMTYETLVETLQQQGLDVKEIVRPHHTTHDIKLENGFIIRLTRESLADIIKREQM